jgi:glycosyltransferase involved in cell wall biosynthesis
VTGSVRRPDLSIIIPAYNEGSNLSATIDDAIRVLTSGESQITYELIVVDDGSNDGTGPLADVIANERDHVSVVHHSANQGFGAALRKGFSVARGTFVTVIPADGEVRVSEALALHALAGDADLVVSRRIRSMPLHREILTRAFHQLQRLVLGFNPEGMDGIFVARRSVVESTPLHSTTGLLQFELFMHCMSRGCSIRRGVMHASPRYGGASKVTRVLSVAKTLREMWGLRSAIDVSRPQ